jgi:hypothetical protein
VNRIVVHGRGRRRWLAPAGTVLLLLTVTVIGCTGGAADEGAVAGRPAARTRPAVKETCPDVAWQPPPSVAVQQGTRELVPFGPTLLGVDSTWQGDGFTVETRAGGYVDDLTEPYDNLRTTGTLSLTGDPAAEVMHGSLGRSPVLLVLWRDGSESAPCDIHAFLVQGADPATEALLIGGLR